MRFDDYEKTRFVRFVAYQFDKLSQEVSQRGRPEAVRKVFKEQIEPRLQVWKTADPELYSRLPPAGYLMDEDYEKYSLPENVPELNGISSNHSGSWGSPPRKDIWITHKMILENMPEDARKEAQKAGGLEDQSKRVQDQLTEYLKPFTNPAQLSFSFPQLHTMYCIHERKQIKPQKRPRIFKKPSEELKTLVLQALVIAQAKGRS